MTKLVAGMDISGDSVTGNYKYLAIVIGIEEYIHSSFNRIGYKGFHMNRIENKKRHKEIITKLRFDNIQCIVLCIRIDKDPILRKLLNKRKNRSPTKKLERKYNQILWQYLYREEIVDFLIIHGCTIQEITFQCDIDCRDFVKNNGLRYSGGGKAYLLADVIAWLNNKNKEPIGVRSLDMTDMLEEKMEKYAK